MRKVLYATFIMTIAGYGLIIHTALKNGERDDREAFMNGCRHGTVLGQLPDLKGKDAKEYVDEFCQLELEAFNRKEEVDHE